MRQSNLELRVVLASVLQVSDSFPNAKWPPSEVSDKVETQHSRPTVLLVDDERLIVDTLGEILEDAGFLVVPAYDARTALEKVAHRRPDYLLSDVLMPTMNGVELAIEIRKRYPATRIVLFSGQAGIAGILLEGQRQGFEFELIAKPIHPLKVIEYLKGSRP